MEYFSVIKKKEIAICDNMGETSDCYAKQNKLGKEAQILNDCSYT